MLVVLHVEKICAVTSTVVIQYRRGAVEEDVVAEVFVIGSFVYDKLCVYKLSELSSRMNLEHSA